METLEKLFAELPEWMQLYSGCVFKSELYRILSLLPDKTWIGFLRIELWDHILLFFSNQCLLPLKSVLY